MTGGGEAVTIPAGVPGRFSNRALWKPLPLETSQPGGTCTSNR